MTFDKASIIGFIIKINDQKGFSRDLMTVYKTTDSDKFTTFLRESSVKNTNGKLNGEVVWYTATYDRLNEMSITDNKISNFKIFTSGEPFSLKNSRFASVQGCHWQCTSADFNCEYQSAKNACESDWQCDFACSFNSCSIAYMAAAVSACTVCNF